MHLYLRLKSNSSTYHRWTGLEKKNYEIYQVYIKKILLFFINFCEVFLYISIILIIKKMSNFILRIHAHLYFLTESTRRQDRKDIKC